MADNKLPYLLFGLGLGVAVGILFAQQSGEETRCLLMSKADESKDYLKRCGCELKESASGLVDKGRDLVKSQRENLTEAVEAGKQAYRDTVGEAPSSGHSPAEDHS